MWKAFNPRGIAFATKCTAAALCAIAFALWLDLPSPGWAGLTVFLTSQQLAAASGAVVARSVYRILGTLVAMASTLVIIPGLASDGPLLIIALAAWVASCLYLSLLHRGPRSYAWLLAGYTLPLVGMSQAGAPGALFTNLVLVRVEEIALGAFFSLVVHSLFAPRSLRPVVVAKVNAITKDAEGWIVQGLGIGPAGDAESRARERVAADLIELRNLAAQMRYEPGIAAQEVDVVTALEQRMVALLPLLAGVEQRLAAVEAGDGELWQRVRSHLDRVAACIINSREPADMLQLAESGRNLVDADAVSLPAGHVHVMGAMERLAELLEALSDCRVLALRLRGEAMELDARTRELTADAARRELHVDHGLAAHSGLAAGMSVAVAGSLCWVIGWDSGNFALGIAAAASSLFAFADDPRPMQRTLLSWSMVAIAVAALYVFAVFPALDGVGQLCVALAPLYFLTALYVAMPSLSLPAITLAMVSQTLLSLQPVQIANFTSFTGTAIGALLGNVIALGVTSLIRVIEVQTSIRRLMHAAWRELAALASGGQAVSREGWASRMLDRIGLLMPRAAQAGGPLRERATRALADLGLGVNLLDLRPMLDADNPEVRAAVEAALEHVARHFLTRIERPDAAADASLSASIDHAIAQLLASAPGRARTQALVAATGLRLELVPAARGS